TDRMIQNGYDQDDVYLSVTAIEALSELGLDATSRQLGIYMYNKDFEFWNGSNNDALFRGYAPPYAGYPMQATGDYTCAYSDGNSYQCGASFGGFLGLNMTGFANEICQRFGEICTYGDGIYSTQFIAAMYGAAFFTDDLDEIISAGLAAIPSDSWSAMVIRDVLKNYADGMTAQQNWNFLYENWITNQEYNWTIWPYGDGVTPGTGILLDAKMCSAFTVIGLLYGEKDIEKSMKITVQCANDSDSTSAATAGILSTILGWNNLDAKYKNGLIEDQKIKYTRSTVDGVAEKCVELIKEIVVREGGKVAYVDGKLSLVIPKAAKQATIETYKNSKNPAPMEVATYTDEERAQMRILSDPGFERSGRALANGWTASAGSDVSVEFLQQTAYTGQSNAKLKASQGKESILYIGADVKPNTNYVVRCKVQASEGFSSEFSLAAWNSAGALLRSSVCRTESDWIEVTLTFNSGNNSAVRIGVRLNGANDTDFVRLDDFELFIK
ncbi:MAG: ADP-ribosylglycohydrolase family protein, partial [Candidatus Gallimonas sp.]